MNICARDCGFAALTVIARVLVFALLAMTSVHAQEGAAPSQDPTAAPGPVVQSQGAQPADSRATPSAGAIPVVTDTRPDNGSRMPAADQTAPTAEPDLKHSPATAPRQDPRYHIGPGDVLAIHVFDRPNLSRDEIRVDAMGMIRLPLISEVKAACLAENELADVLAQQYSVYLKDPQIDVFVKDFSSEPVEVNGAVQKPGAFQLERQVRLRELLMIAGGPTPAAGPNIQILHDESALLCEDPAGKSSPSREAELVNYNDMVKGVGDNPFVHPGDFINVPEGNQAYVVGNVYKPTPVALNDPVTISRAIAIAGGTLPNSQGKIRLIRATSTGGTREIVLDLKTVNTQMKEDLTLQPGDIVEVPFSTTKAILKAVFTSFASAATIYYPLIYIK